MFNFSPINTPIRTRQETGPREVSELPEEPEFAFPFSPIRSPRYQSPQRIRTPRSPTVVSHSNAIRPETNGFNNENRPVTYASSMEFLIQGLSQIHLAPTPILSGNKHGSNLSSQNFNRYDDNREAQHRLSPEKLRLVSLNGMVSHPRSVAEPLLEQQSDIEALKSIRLDPILVPPLLLDESQRVEMNYFKLLLAYNQLVEKVATTNSEICSFNDHYDRILEVLQILGINSAHESSDILSNNSMRVPASTGNTAPQPLSPLDLEEDFDSTFG